MMEISKSLKNANIAHLRKMRQQDQSVKRKNANKIELDAHFASYLVTE